MLKMKPHESDNYMPEMRDIIRNFRNTQMPVASCCETLRSTSSALHERNSEIKSYIKVRNTE